MSLTLENTKPHPIDVSASGITASDSIPVLRLYGRGIETTIQISMQDFRALVMYVMCNANLLNPEDPRIELLEDLRSLTIIEDEFGRRFSGLRQYACHFSKRA